MKLTAQELATKLAQQIDNGDIDGLIIDEVTDQNTYNGLTHEKAYDMTLNDELFEVTIIVKKVP